MLLLLLALLFTLLLVPDPFIELCPFVIPLGGLLSLNFGESFKDVDPFGVL